MPCHMSVVLCWRRTSQYFKPRLRKCIWSINMPPWYRWWTQIVEQRLPTWDSTWAKIKTKKDPAMKKDTTSVNCDCPWEPHPHKHRQIIGRCVENFVLRKSMLYNAGRVRKAARACSMFFCGCVWTKMKGEYRLNRRRDQTDLHVPRRTSRFKFGIDQQMSYVPSMMRKEWKMWQKPR